MKVNYNQRVPFSFSRDKYHILNKISQKNQNQPETNQHSDTSEFKLQSKMDKNYNKLIKSLTEQMQYYKSALKTAENLIKNYQNQTNNLREQNIRLSQQVNSVTSKLENVERLLFKFFQCQRSPKYSHTDTTTKNSFYSRDRQNLKTFCNNEDTDDQNYYGDMENKISNIINQQYRYEEQIFELNKKIKYLEKFHQTNQKLHQKNRMKTSTIYLPFASKDGLKEQKQKMSRQVLNLFGNEKTLKTIVTKQSQFKKNLQKQFEEFLQGRRNTVKSKNSATKVSNSYNKDSSLSISTEKKNRRKTISVSKRL